ncbi:serine hydrolase domain-containing protein [Streptomyces sp. NPDC018019]|uniref:serine hydrolase domain-containing protein n=1 Tax=Streptomyces sp. NPDC018019 TaxID=3365030 RepID=UPI0037A015E2
MTYDGIQQDDPQIDGLREGGPDPDAVPAAAPQVPQGHVADGFASVRAEFAAFLEEERPDYSGQLVVYAGQEKVVDLWAGPGFGPDSLLGVYSSTKGAAYLTVALLVQEGVLALDTAVSHYWPEFGAEGKTDVTLGDLLAHRAGVPGVDGGLSPEELLDEPYIAERLAAQRPYWRPGSAFGYHALVIGALAGEVVRRVTGQPLQAVYEERIRAPYDIDFHLGLPEEHEPRVQDIQPMLPTPEQQAELAAAETGPESLTGIAFNRNHPQPTDLESLPNSRAVRAAGPASVGGVASARGLAKLYAAAVSGVDGKGPLLKPSVMAEFAQIRSHGEDLVARFPLAFGAGFHAVGALYPALGQGAFGHDGAGGSQAFADPRSGFTYGYARRRYAFPGGPAPENARLADAVHRAVTARRRTGIPAAAGQEGS